MPTNNFTDHRIDELGARLRRGEAATNPSTRALYRRYRAELNGLRRNLESELRALSPESEISSRTKRIETVAAKLQRRPELALSQVTDLAGCRIIAPSRDEQLAVVSRLRQVYDVQEVDDKSDAPKSGYRAVHLDIRYRGQLMEIQVQTHNQRRWQQVSEEAAGYDVSIKYGGGHPEVSRALLELSELAWQCDREGTFLPDAAVDRARDAIELFLAEPGE